MTLTEETIEEAPPYADPPVRGTANINIQWGLLSLPLQLFSGAEPIQLIERHTYTAAGNPAGTQPIDKVTGEPYKGDIVKKVTLGDKLVELTDDEIATAAAGHAVDRLLVEIEALVPLAEVGGRYMPLKRYQVRPAKIEVSGKKRPNPAANKAFALFTAVLADEQCGALVKFAVRGEVPRYAVVLPDGTLLTLLFDDEVRAPREFPDVEISEGELAQAQMLLGTIPVDCPPLINHARAAVEQYVADKAAGVTVETPAEAEAPAAVAAEADIMALLEASVAAARITSNPRKPRATTAARGKRTPATKKADADA